MAERRQDGRRGWFAVDNAIVDRFGREVGAHGIGVYNVLARHADQDGRCWPALGSIAEALGISRSTVHRALHTLASSGLIEIEPRYAGRGGRESNAYRLLRVELPACGRPDRRPEKAEGPTLAPPAHPGTTLEAAPAGDASQPEERRRHASTGPTPMSNGQGGHVRADTTPVSQGNGGHVTGDTAPMSHRHGPHVTGGQEQDLTNNTHTKEQQQAADERDQAIGQAFASFCRRFYLVTGGVPQLEIEELAGRLYDRGAPGWWDLALDAAEAAGARHLNYVKAVVERALRDGTPPDSRARRLPGPGAAGRGRPPPAAGDGYGLSSIGGGPRARDPTPEELEELRTMGVEWLGEVR